MFCPNRGQELGLGARFCSKCGAASEVGGGRSGELPASRDGLLAAIRGALVADQRVEVRLGEESDIEMHNSLAEGSWVVGKKKVEFVATLLAKESERTVVYWEMVKERGSGMGLFAFFKVEKYSSDGKTRSGSVRESGWGPQGKAIDYNWDYSRIRKIVEETTKACGWRFSTSLLRRHTERQR